MTNWSFLFFLGEPWFVIPWYAVGLAGLGYLVYDTRNHNTVLKPAMQWAWPVIVFFFSVLGLALYFLTARAPGIQRLGSQGEKQAAHDRYERSMWRRVNGASSHCVAGDGFGIMTAMIIARAAGLNFWQEYWFEYLVGFAIGMFVFQRKSMTMMTDSLPRQLWMAFRGEFFSMLTVMGGMGAVMTFITPQVVTAQPKPLTAAFWGFGMLGLLVGYALTFPMNWLLVMVGWKHGMGRSEAPLLARPMPIKLAALAMMILFGAFGQLLPAWLTWARQGAPQERGLVAATRSQQPAGALYAGLRSSIEKTQRALHEGNRTDASLALDDAFRVAQVATYSAPGSFYAALEQLQDARYALQQGQTRQADQHLARAWKVLVPAREAAPPLLELSKYQGAHVLDASGRTIGEVVGISGDTVTVALGGWRDAWGFVDFSRARTLTAPAHALAFGPPRDIGQTMVVLPVRS